MSQFGFDIDFDIEKETIYDKIKNNPINSNLFDTFIVPPFSVFDTRSKLWIDRKNEWLSLGIKSELGRGDKLLFCDSLKNDSLPQTSIFNPVFYKGDTKEIQNNFKVLENIDYSLEEF